MISNCKDCDIAAVPLNTFSFYAVTFKLKTIGSVPLETSQHVNTFSLTFKLKTIAKCKMQIRFYDSRSTFVPDRSVGSKLKKKFEKNKIKNCWTFDLGHLTSLKFILFYVAVFYKPAISQSPTAYEKCNFRVLHNFCYML
jgi:hypothetical protein